MTKIRRKVGGVFFAAFVLAGCAGDGTGLDEFGNPLQDTTVPLGPTLRAIQFNVFNPICTQCHTGSSAPLGLALDSTVAFQNLVNVQSVEVPALLRVKPGDPDSSYVIWKIEGRAGIQGGRMPLGMQPLSAETIDAFRGWIANGANNN